MARDYKTRTARRRSSGASARRKSGGRGRARASGAAPGWQWLLAGFAAGLLVAAAVFVYDRTPGLGATVTPARPAPSPVPERDARPPALTEPEPEPPAPEYDFYRLLPTYEVVVTEEQADLPPDKPLPPVRTPGTYVLQAGSFRNHADADRRQAELALQGIESHIEVAVIDAGQRWHRVRVGPLRDLEELNRIRTQLRSAGVETAVFRAREDG